ncbi:MAG: DUF494 domain-containing protein [Gammaproteobacteria bacterium]|nr:DUF494 domain-containing protein [Gammaproteobacteria bacterium]
MRENVLEVLMYLFENYLVDGVEYQPDHELLTNELANAGFADGEIDKAFNWLEDLATMCDGRPVEGGGSQSGVRHFNSVEEAKLDTDARGLLLSLEQTGVLDSHTREMVIDRVIALETEELGLDQLKWVVMMILCNRPDQQNTLAWAEKLVTDGAPTHLH